MFLLSIIRELVQSQKLLSKYKKRLASFLFTSIRARDQILKEPVPIDKDGYVHIPQGLGLGVELNQTFIEQCTIG